MTSHSEKLNLDQLIKNSDAVDNTEHIRTIKHASKIEKDVAKFLELKRTYHNVSNDMFDKLCLKHCSFLHTNYTHIYNKLVRNELDLGMFGKFITVLKQIEDGKEDQHSASVIIGTILKEIYIDSALKKQAKEDKKNKQKNKKKKIVEAKKNKILKEKFPEAYKKATLTWREYKTQNQEN